MTIAAKNRGQNEKREGKTERNGDKTALKDGIKGNMSTYDFFIALYASLYLLNIALFAFYVVYFVFVDDLKRRLRVKGSPTIKPSVGSSGRRHRVLLLKHGFAGTVGKSRIRRVGWCYFRDGLLAWLGK